MKNARIQQLIKGRPEPTVFEAENALKSTQPAKTVAIGYNLPEKGGQLVYMEGVPYPYKGFPFDDAVWIINPIKRFFLSLSRASRAFWYLLPILIMMPKFILRPALRKLHDIFISQFIWSSSYSVRLKERYYCDCVREFRRACKKVSSEERFFHYVDLISLILEYDNAYRWRIQDIVEEIDKKAFKKRTLRELWRLADIGAERESAYICYRSKYRMIATSIAFVLKFNRDIRKLVFSIIDELDIEKFKLDENDLYWNYPRFDYNTRGIGLDSRLKIYHSLMKAFDEHFNKQKSKQKPEKKRRAKTKQRAIGKRKKDARG